MEYKNKVGKPCTAAQYITELILKRRAEKDNKPLPVNFYKVDPWQKIYKMTIVKANTLLKLYDEEAILKALTEEGKNIYSLNANWLVDIIEKKEKEIAARTKVEYKISSTDSKPQKVFNKNILEKLK